MISTNVLYTKYLITKLICCKYWDIFFFILDQLCLQHHSYGHNSHHRNRKNSHCKPHCDVLHSKCVRDYFGGTRKNSFSCRCLPGFAPTYLPANSILYSSQRRLVFCQPTMTNGTLQGSASAGGVGVLANNGLFAHNATVPFKYYPGKIDVVSFIPLLSWQPCFSRVAMSKRRINI